MTWQEEQQVVQERALLPTQLQEVAVVLKEEDRSIEFCCCGLPIAGPYGSAMPFECCRICLSVYGLGFIDTCMCGAPCMVGVGLKIFQYYYNIQLVPFNP